MAAASFSYADTLYYMQSFPTGDSSNTADGASFFDTNDVSVAKKKARAPKAGDTVIFADYDFKASQKVYVESKKNDRYYDQLTDAQITSLTSNIHNAGTIFEVENLSFSLSSGYKHRGPSDCSLETTARKDFGITTFCPDATKAAEKNIVRINGLLKVDGGKSFYIQGGNDIGGRNYCKEISVGEIQMTDGATLEGYSTALSIAKWWTSLVNVGVNTTNDGSVAANGKTSLIGENTTFSLGANKTETPTGGQTVNLGSIENNGTMSVGSGNDLNQYGTFTNNGSVTVNSANFVVNGSLVSNGKFAISKYAGNFENRGNITMRENYVNESGAEATNSTVFSQAAKNDLYGTFTVDGSNATGNAKTHYEVWFYSDTVIHEGAVINAVRGTDANCGNVILGFGNGGNVVNYGTINLDAKGARNAFLHLMPSKSFKGMDSGVINLLSNGATIYFGASDTELGNVQGSGSATSRASSSTDATVAIGTNNVSKLFDANLSFQNGGNSTHDGVLSVVKNGKSWQRIYGGESNYTGTTTVNDGALFIAKTRRNLASSQDNGMSTVVTLNGGYFGSAGRADKGCYIDGISFNSGKLLYNFEFGNSLQITMKDSSALLGGILASDFAFANATSMIGVKTDLFWFDGEDVESIGSYLQAIIDSDENGKYEFVDVKTGNTYYAEFSSEDPTVFSVTLSVPEPSTWAAIFGALALAFAIYRRRK